MKKWIGALCSGLAGVLTLVFLTMPALTFKMMGEKESYSGWKLLTDSDIAKADYTAVTWYRIFAWILVVLAVVLIVLAVLQILANLNIVKMPAILSTVGKFALIGLVLVSILALLANIGIRAEMIDEFKDALGKDAAKEYGKMLKIGASLIVVTVVNLIACVCGNLFAKNEK